MPTQIEEIPDSSMGSHKSLSLGLRENPDKKKALQLESRGRDSFTLPWTWMDVASEKNSIYLALLQTWLTPPTAWPSTPRAVSVNI